VVSSAVDLDDPPDETRDATARSQRRRDPIRTAARGIGQTLITLGLVTLLFVGYELWVTDILSAREQDKLSEQLQDEWGDLPTVGEPGSPTGSSTGPAPGPVQVSPGEPFAVLHIPRLGSDWTRVAVEGVTQTDLAQGPGHYPGTALPGEQGNFAMAGHRVGRGSPFLDLDKMQPGDPIVVETAEAWFVYRVLGDTATGSFDGDRSGLPGQEIVRPEDVDVISPTPRSPVDAPATGAFLTLTTCHPKYSAQQRLIIHARLDGTFLSKVVAPDGPPALTE
jgi:sortase (surface protein transpeptidase)